MFKITKSLSTHGLGDEFYPHPKDKLRTGERIGFGWEWIIVDCRDLEDNWNPPMKYAEKILEVERTINPDYEPYYGCMFFNCAVCCGAGMSRSNAVALGYLLYTGKTWEEAWKMIHAEGSIAQIEPGHITALKSLFGIKDTFAGKILDHAEGDYDLEEKNKKAMEK